MVTKILRLPEVKLRTGLSRSSVYLRISQQRFPRPISLGAQSVGWIESEIEGWIESQIFVSRNRGKRPSEQFLDSVDEQR
jgi:prophage regulatory protein